MKVQCLKCYHVRVCDIPLGRSILDPKQRSVPRGSNRHERGSYRSRSISVERGVRRCGPSSPGQVVERGRGQRLDILRQGGKQRLRPDR